MLLDFNLAADLKSRPGAGARAGVIGGTLPYMAPEHLDAFRGGRRPVDARSDIYAFGVIFYEMLTRPPPFPVRDGPRPATRRPAPAGARPRGPGPGPRPSRRPSSRPPAAAWRPTRPTATSRPTSCARTSAGTWRTGRSSTPPTPRPASGRPSGCGVTSGWPP